MKPMRICIDARQPGVGLAGGVEQFAIGLASGLSRLSDGDEEYVFLVRDDSHAWLLPYIGGSCRILPVRKAASRPDRLRRLIYRIHPDGDPCKARYYQTAGALTWRLQRSLGIVEKAGFDLMHFTFQSAFLTKVPSIYHPHDLQHLHLPQYFTPKERRSREARYRSYCMQARMVSVSSTWTKRDLVAQYGLSEEKVCVVPLAPLLGAYRPPSAEEIALVRRKYSLPGAFVFFPAATWPHKNHIGLLEAIAALRKIHGMEVPVVFSGGKTDFFPNVQRRAQELSLGGQVRFLGFVSVVELQSLYRLCRCVVVPTKFEAASFPLWEAFAAGAPAACSNVTSLPEQAGDAALVFDPYDPAEIAQAIRRLWTDPALREALAERGLARSGRFSWERTARIFRAHYRRLGGRPLGDEDRELIDAPPLL